MEAELTDGGGTIVYANNIPGTPPAMPLFSQVAWAGDTAYLAGQIGLDAATGKLVAGGVTAEAEKIFENLERTLKGVGLSFADVAKVSVYLTRIEDFPLMNQVYLNWMKGVRPARETVAVSALALGASIEITMTAYRGPKHR